jgi:WD40 repeat protein
MLSFRLSEASIPFLTPTAAAISFGGAHGTKILILVRSGEMCELAINSGRVVLLTEAHARRKKQATEAHGLDVNPKYGDIYATSGDDGTVRAWSCASRRCVMRVTPDVLGGAAARCCSWAPDGIRLAVGLGGDPADKARDGTLIILNMKLEVSGSVERCDSSITREQ